MSEVIEKPKLDRYRVIHLRTSAELEDFPEEYLEKINALAEIGYKVHTYAFGHALMELKDDYSGVTNLKDVPPEEVDEFLANGWTIASSSISTKFIRMVRRKI